MSKVIVGAIEPQQLSPATPNPGDITGEYGAALVSGAETIGYMRLAIDYQGHEYTIKALMDASCSLVMISGVRGRTSQLGVGVAFQLGGQTFVGNREIWLWHKFGDTHRYGQGRLSPAVVD